MENLSLKNNGHDLNKIFTLLGTAFLIAFVLTSGVFSDIVAAVAMSANTRRIVGKYIDAGMGAASIIALLGGGGLIVLIVKQAFRSGIKKVILAA